MGYQKANGRYAKTRNCDIVAALPDQGDTMVAASSGAKTASFTGPAVELGDANDVRLTLSVTAASGTTPSMTVTIETSSDGSTGWTSVGAFTAATAVGSQRKVFGPLDRFVRQNVAISGTTPSFTYTLAGEAV